MGLEKTSIESKGKKSGVAPVMWGVEPGLGVRNLFQDSVSGRHDLMTCFKRLMLNMMYKVKTSAISNEELTSTINKELLQIGIKKKKRYLYRKIHEE